MQKAINIELVKYLEHSDPCLYILRFASKLEFGAKTQQVANTALRLVQRMKRDSIHSGRRPSGLCGAALLIAARLHEFGRSSKDIVKIVKVHESTLRKRLIEFGDTPSSALTLDEFMNVDLEEEQDPPSFKAARKKDKERLQKLIDEEADNFTKLQEQIEKELEQNIKKRQSVKGVSLKSNEIEDAQRFIEESTMRTVTALLGEEAADDPEAAPEIGLGPDVASMGLAASLEDTTNAPKTAHEDDVRIDLDMDLEGIDDDEIDTYIMNEKEFEYKNVLWHRKNADYLEEQKVKAERLQKERDEGKPEKKRKRTTKRKAIGPANSAGEAIEKIVQEKKISTKINYDVLKSLSAAPTPCETVDVETEDAATTSESIKRRRLSSVSNYLEASETSNRRKTKGKFQMGLPVFEDTPKEDLNEVITKEGKMKKEEETKKEPTIIVSEDEMDEDYEDDEQPAETNNEMGVLQMLRQHREDEEDPQEFGYGYYEEPDY